MARTTGAATDLITFSRASSGIALTKVAYGAELLTNGDFSAGTTNWNASSAGSVFYIENGVAVVEALPSDWSRLAVVTNINMELNEVYALTFTNEGVGNVSIQQWIPGAGNYYNYAPGTHTIYAVCDDTADTFQFITATQNAELRISNVSVRKVLTNDPTGTLKLVPHGINKPRVEYDANGVAKGLLIEEARTNLVTYSEDFASTFWPKSDVSVVASTAVDPSGATDSYELIEAATTANHLLNRASLTTGAATHTHSIYAKANTRSWIRVQNQSPSNSWVNVNLENGQVGLSGGGEDSYSVVSVGNGWYRISLISTTGAGNGPQIFILDSDRGSASPSYLGDGTSSILIYGAQFETGSFPTSYIPTSGATATRSADIASVSVSEFGYNQAQGSVVVNFEASRALDSNAVLVNPSDGTTSNRMTLWGGTTSGTTLFVVDSGVAQATLVGGIPAAGTHKTAIAYATNDFALTLDAGAIQSDTLGTVPTVSQIDIGRYASDLPLNGHIKSLNYYPLRLSDAKLQSLTS